MFDGSSHDAVPVWCYNKLLAYSVHVYNGVGDAFLLKYYVDVTLEDQSKQSYNYNRLWFIYKKCT